MCEVNQWCMCNVAYWPLACLGAPPSAIRDLREQCKPDQVSKKPKNVTDQQLLKVVDELSKETASVREYAERRGSDGHEWYCKLAERVEDLEAGRRWVWVAYVALAVFLCVTLVVAK